MILPTPTHPIRLALLWTLPTLLTLLARPLVAATPEQTAATIARHVDSAKGVEIAFTLLSTDEQGERNGHYYSVGNKFYFESAELRAWHDGTHLWVYIDGNGEVNLSTPKPEDLADINPLVNLDRIRQSDFKLTTAPATQTGCTLLTATPTARYRGEIEWVRVTADRTLRPTLLEIKEKGFPDTLRVRIRSIKQGIDFPSALFSFESKKLPGVSVIDLR